MSVTIQNTMTNTLNSLTQNCLAFLSTTEGKTQALIVPTIGIVSAVLIVSGIAYLITQGSLRRALYKQLSEISFQLSRAKHRVQNYEKILQRHYALATRPIIGELSVIRRIVGCLEERLLAIDSELSAGGAAGVHEASRLYSEPLDINCGKNAMFEVVVGKFSKGAVGDLYLDTIAEELTKRYHTLDEMLRAAWSDYEEVAFAQ